MTNYLVAIITLIGTIGNAFGKEWSFKVWLITNIYWVIYNYINGDIPQCLIFTANVIVCIIAIITWRKRI